MSNFEKKIASKLETVTYHFNTKFRDKYYQTPSTKCRLTFLESEKFKSLTLQDICIPNSWYLFSNLLENNKFIIQIESTKSGSIEILEVVIPEGNWTPDELTTFLNKTYFYESGRTYGFVKIKMEINSQTLKTNFSMINTLIEDVLKFHIIFITGTTLSIMSTCGWLLGFRYGKYFNIKDELYSEALFDGGGDRYVYFCLNNKEFDEPYNKHLILLENERESNKSKTVLAKINLKNGKFALDIDENTESSISYKKTILLKKSKKISFLDINLLDQYGQEIFLNNMDFSFSIEFVKAK